MLVGAGVFAWMSLSGKLDLATVGSSLAQWPLMLAIILAGYGQVALNAWRWQLLLRAQGIALSFRRTWGLTMIGMLFNVVIPGAVGGDLIKGYYITRANANRKAHSATTILVDRVTGLLGLLFLGAAVVTARWTEIMRAPETRTLGLLATGSAILGITGLYVAVYAGKRLSELTLLPSLVRSAFSALHEYRNQSSVIPRALALSVLGQASGCGMYYLALLATGVRGMPVSVFFLVVPFGMITTALPISPGGVGVGQAAFFALFRIVAPQYAAAGTNALTVFQVMFILICVSGLYWYISYKHSENSHPDRLSATPPD